MAILKNSKFDKVYLVIYAPPVFPFREDMEVLAVFDTKKAANNYVIRNAKETGYEKRYYRIDEHDVYIA